MPPPPPYQRPPIQKIRCPVDTVKLWEIFPYSHPYHAAKTAISIPFVYPSTHPPGCSKTQSPRRQQKFWSPADAAKVAQSSGHGKNFQVQWMQQKLPSLADMAKLSASAGHSKNIQSCCGNPNILTPQKGKNAVDVPESEPSRQLGCSKR